MPGGRRLRKWDKVVDRHRRLGHAVAVPTQGNGLESARIALGLRQPRPPRCDPREGSADRSGGHQGLVCPTAMSHSLGLRRGCHVRPIRNHADVPSLREHRPTARLQPASDQGLVASTRSADRSAITSCSNASRSDAPVETSFENVRDLAFSCRLSPGSSPSRWDHDRVSGSPRRTFSAYDERRTP